MERLLTDAQKLTGVKYDINNLGDVYNAIHAVQGELGLTGVAAGEAETTLTGSFGAMKASWENTMAALMTGQGLDVAMANLTTSVQNFANNVLAMLGQLAPQIPGFIMGIAQAAIDNAPAMLAAGLEMVLQIAVGLVQAIPQLVDKMPELYQSAKEAFGAVDWGQLGKDLIFGVIRGIDAALTALWEKIKSVGAGIAEKMRASMEIGSPSRVMADEVGRWIPAGVALGIDENTEPLNASIVRLADSTAAQFERATAPGNAWSGTAPQGERIDYARLAEAISSRPVVIQGDTAKIFRVVRSTNTVRTRATNYNALGAMT